MFNVAVRMGEKEGIVQFKYENGNMIVYNPDIQAIIETIKVLNRDLEFEFEIVMHSKIKEFTH